MINLHTEPVPEEVFIYHSRHLFSLMSNQQKILYIMSQLYPYPIDAKTLPLPKFLHFYIFLYARFYVFGGKQRSLLCYRGTSMNHIIHFMKKLYSSAGKILYVNLFGMVLISLLEGIGIILLIPMISMTGIINLGEETTFIVPVSRFLQDFPKTTSLAFILGIYILIVLGQNLLQRNIALRDARTQQAFVRELRIETYSMILKAKWSFFREKENKPNKYINYRISSCKLWG